ncbi:MAG: hypothetical protein GX447_00765 [Elusimicrobia bacterium]|nr:hypothetical protein [Elusimicrobiota bacterium]
MPEDIKEEDKKNEDQVKRQKKWPATVVLAAPFFLIVIPFYKAAKEALNWPAAIAMIITFEILMFACEIMSVSRGHWVWNPNRTLGPTILGVPIEEPLLYYWFPPLFVVLLMLVIEGYIKKRSDKNG